MGNPFSPSTSDATNGGKWLTNSDTTTNEIKNSFVKCRVLRTDCFSIGRGRGDKRCPAAGLDAAGPFAHGAAGAPEEEMKPVGEHPAHLRTGGRGGGVFIMMLVSFHDKFPIYWGYYTSKNLLKNREK